MDGQNQNPGDTPGSSGISPSAASPVPVVSPAPLPQLPVPPVVPDVSPPAPATSPAEQPAPPTSTYAAGDVDATVAPPVPQKVSWAAAEFIAHTKTPMWYLAMCGVAFVVTALAYLITRDVVTVVVLVICAGLFGYTASRQPRQQDYSLDSTGITVGLKHYSYADFRAFSVIEQDVSSSIDFVPLKRFAPMLTIPFDVTNETEILAILTGHLPFANHQRTMIDGLMHRIHF